MVLFLDFKVFLDQELPDKKAELLYKELATTLENAVRYHAFVTKYNLQVEYDGKE